MKPGDKLDIKFPNGLSLDEGVERASKWWNEIGRIILLKAFEQAQTADDSKFSKGDGIMQGLLYDQLNTREQHKVVTNWYKEIGSKL